MRNKVVSASEAVALISDGDLLATSGFVGIGTPDELLEALAKRFVETGAPKGLTLIFAAGQGDGKERGLNRLAHEGLIKRAVGGHWGLIPKLARLAVEGRIEAYNFPQGCISHLYREIAAGKRGLLSKVGLRTFVDPRLDGGRINAATTEELVSLVEFDGEEMLCYRAAPINVAFIRGTTADPAGNITMEREALTLDALAMATAAKNSRGLVIAQVERIAARGSLNPRQVKVPGVLVDCVVVAKAENHPQTYATRYSPYFSAETRRPLDDAPPAPLDLRKIIGRRCAMELPVNGVVNLGIGMPEAVAAVAQEERLLEHITLTAEPGVIGGLPAGGLDFGAASNNDALINQNEQFDFYDGGGLDLACLGMAEADGEGNVNVSRFGKRLAGSGGFINISQNARKLVFAGAFAADGLVAAIEDGRLRIVREGSARKFVEKVGQITFSGALAREREQPVLYVTERCVFELRADGMTLIEVADGIDPDRDVLAQLAFRPKVDIRKSMDQRIFRDAPMGLRADLLDIDFEHRVAYDAGRDTVFVNLEGAEIRVPADIDAFRAAIEAVCAPLGRKTRAVVNYDAFEIAGEMKDAYADFVAEMVARYYDSVSRYTTSAFMRLKLEKILTRRVAPHIFESAKEARKFVEKG
ncbi:MAG: acyl CoA:acetate/3-ketoacid CoA transferase [Pseudomonadota bacterium]